MLNVEYLREGQTIFGRPERNVEGKFFRPEYKVVRVDAQEDLVHVNNRRGETRAFSPRDLFTVGGIEAYYRRNHKGLIQLLGKMIAASLVEHPEYKEELREFMPRKRRAAS